MSRNVLFVAYFYPPLANSGTQRPLKLANHLPDFGWKPLVLTVDSPPDAEVDRELLDEVRPGTHITRVKMLSDVFGNTSISSAISWRLRMSFQSPDLYALWRPTAVRAGVRLFKKVGFDAVWATGFPWTSLLVGRDLSRRLGLPLIADFRDPWTGEDMFNPVSPGALPAHRRLEQSVLAQASAVTATADQQTTEFRRLTRNPDGKLFVTIPNGFDCRDADGAALATPQIPRKARLRIVYAGVWKVGYNLEALYQAVRMLEESGLTSQDVEIIAAGFAPGHARRLGVDRFVTELGTISHRAALGLMRTADVLFLPAPAGMRRRMCVPGKLYEYAAASRPILALSDPGTAVDGFLAEIGGSVMLRSDDVGLLARAIVSASRGELSFPPFNRERVDQYERKILTRKLAEVLYKVTGSQAESLTELKPASQSC